MQTCMKFQQQQTSRELFLPSAAAGHPLREALRDCWGWGRTHKMGEAGIPVAAQADSSVLEDSLEGSGASPRHTWAGRPLERGTIAPSHPHCPGSGFLSALGTLSGSGFSRPLHAFRLLPISSASFLPPLPGNLLADLCVSQRPCPQRTIQGPQSTPSGHW